MKNFFSGDSPDYFQKASFVHFLSKGSFPHYVCQKGWVFLLLQDTMFDYHHDRQISKTRLQILGINTCTAGVEPLALAS